MASRQEMNDGIHLYINGKHIKIGWLDDAKLDSIISNTKALVETCERQITTVQELVDALKTKHKAVKAELESWEEIKRLREERNRIFNTLEDHDE